MPTPIQALFFYLANPIDATQTTIQVRGLKDSRGNALTAMPSGATLIYATIEPRSATNQEVISFTGITDNGNGLVTLTGVTRNLNPQPPYTALAATVPHGNNAECVLSNSPAFYNKFAQTDTDTQITAYWEVPMPIDPNDIASKAYADMVGSAGAADASTSVKGISKLTSAPLTTLGTATITIASPAVVTLNAHGLIAGDKIRFSTTGALPTGITAGIDYYVISSGLTANTFQISTTPTGSAINTSGSQSGVHTLIRTTPYAVGNDDTRMLTQGENDAAVGKSGAGVGTLNKFEDEADTYDGSPIDQQQNSQNATLKAGEADATGKNRRIAQSFIANKSKIATVTIHKLADSGSFTGNVTVSIQADSGGNPSGVDLASAVVSNATWLARATGLYEIALGTPLAVTIGTTYWLVVTPSTADNTNYINLGYQNTNVYASGLLKSYNVTDGHVAVTGDLTFRISTNGANKLARLNSNGKLDAALLSGINLESKIAGEIFDAYSPVFVSSGNSFNRIAAQYNVGTSQQGLNTTSNNRKGQTFNSGAYRTISGVRLYLINNAGSMLDNVTITAELLATSGGIPTGAALGTGTVTAYGWNNGKNLWIDVTFASPVTVSQNTVYAIAVYASNSSIQWLYDGSAGYTSGQGAVETAGSWSADSGRDYRFQTLSGVASPTAGRVYMSSPLDPADESYYSHYGVAVTAAAAVGDTVSVQSRGELSGISLGNLSASQAEAVDQNQSSTFTSFAFDSTNKYARQWFVTGDVGNISAIEVYLGKNATPGDTLRFSIFEVGDDGLEKGQPLGSVTYANADVSGTGFVKKTFGTPVKVKPRTRYILKAVYGTYAATNYFNWYYHNSNVYPQGYNTFNNESVQLGTPFAFKTYSTLVVSAEVGDYVYMGDNPVLSFAGGTRRARVGRILSSAGMDINVPEFEGKLIRSQSHDYGAAGPTASSNFAMPIHKNTRRIVIYTAPNGFLESSSGNVTGAKLAELFLPDYYKNVEYGNDAAGAQFFDGGAYSFNPLTGLLTINYDSGGAGSYPRGTRYLRIYEYR